MMIQNTATRWIRKYIAGKLMPRTQVSYSQFGEDLILAFYFAQKGMEKITYLDVGANEPRFISNTYYFYERGSTGVLVEPNPFLSKKLKSQRGRDTVVNAGAGFGSATEADFYLFPDYANGLSTFSKAEADHWQEKGMKGMGKIPVQQILRLPLIPLNDILKKYFSASAPDLLSIDVEGLDLKLLQDMDFETFRPLFICVETFKYDDNQKGRKDPAVNEFMQTVNYKVYADTGVNTIFIKGEAAI